MDIETRQYRLDPAVFRRAAVRTYWSLLWPVLILGMVGVVGLWVIGMGFVSSIPLLVVIAIPYLAASRKVSQVRAVGGFDGAFVVKFADDGVTEFAPFQSVYVRYEQYASFERIKEGIRTSRRGPGWTLIPREAFLDDEQYREVCIYLIKVGKMRQGLSEM